MILDQHRLVTGTRTLFFLVHLLIYIHSFCVPVIANRIENRIHIAQIACAPAHSEYVVRTIPVINKSQISYIREIGNSLISPKKSICALAISCILHKLRVYSFIFMCSNFIVCCWRLAMHNDVNWTRHRIRNV